MGQRKVGYAENEAEIAFIRKAYEDCSAFLAICGGYESAHRAGLLKGKTATAPRVILHQLREESPETNWIEQRWARDGKMWTSGILLNGLDLMMAFVSFIPGAMIRLIQTLTFCRLEIPGRTKLNW